METSLLLKEKISESNLGDISYEYDKLRNPMKTFPNGNTTKVEFAEYDNPIKSTVLTTDTGSRPVPPGPVGSWKLEDHGMPKTKLFLLFM